MTKLTLFLLTALTFTGFAAQAEPDMDCQGLMSRATFRGVSFNTAEKASAFDWVRGKLEVDDKHPNYVGFEKRDKGFKIIYRYADTGPAGRETGTGSMDAQLDDYELKLNETLDQNVALAKMAKRDADMQPISNQIIYERGDTEKTFDKCTRSHEETVFIAKDKSKHTVVIFDKDICQSIEAELKKKTTKSEFNLCLKVSDQLAMTAAQVTKCNDVINSLQALYKEKNKTLQTQGKSLQFADKLTPDSFYNMAGLVHSCKPSEWYDVVKEQKKDPKLIDKILSPFTKELNKDRKIERQAR